MDTPATDCCSKSFIRDEYLVEKTKNKKLPLKESKLTKEKEEKKLGKNVWQND